MDTDQLHESTLLRIDGASLREALMLCPGPAKKLIITVNEANRWHGQSVTNALLVLFRHRRLAGATVSRAIVGFTGRGTIPTIDKMDGAMPLPVRIEVVDTPEAIDRVLADVYDIVEKGLVEPS